MAGFIPSGFESGCRGSCAVDHRNGGGRGREPHQGELGGSDHGGEASVGEDVRADSGGDGPHERVRGPAAAAAGAAEARVGPCAEGGAAAAHRRDVGGDDETAHAFLRSQSHPGAVRLQVSLLPPSFPPRRCSSISHPVHLFSDPIFLRKLRTMNSNPQIDATKLVAVILVPQSSC